ncbi:hypothetical protein [Sapientia aquatica]|uniref:Uncharacterized protein n=1 Tax=Sapientia aquatica TaxID=1549640 RepID=A0A4R5VR89_9BURK|nr:hypothetical protein [Sapientia aquatica]TDK61184.1 hypothetical protein E2I14_17475 [Sapientia aquatica]
MRIILLRIDRHPNPVPVAEHADSPPPNLGGLLFLDASDHLVAQRYDASDGSFYLIRPDQHVCARWRQVNLALIEQALLRACGINHSV